MRLLAVTLYDTTLRDGSQRAGISYSSQDKVRIAHRLADLGIPYVEGGWPGSNPKDGEFFRLLRERPLRGAKAVAFGSTCRAGNAAESDATLAALLEAGTEAVALFGKSWDYHVTRGLGTTLEENLRMIRESVAYLKRQGREVVYDAEHLFDGFRRNPEYALATLRAAVAGGADWVVLCDTNGGTLPEDAAAVVRRVAAELPGVRLGIHAHDDSGLGVAVTLAAVRAGATMVQGTINGYGERCGNANLCAIIPNLQLKMGIPCLPEDKLRELTAASHFVSEVANLPPWDAQPFVGRNAFAHKAGVHVSALLKDPAMYEHLPPETVGNERRVLVSDVGGRSNLLAAFGDQLSPAEAAALIQQVKERESRGFQYEGAEASVALLTYKGKAPFEVLGVKLMVTGAADGPAESEVAIKLRVGDQIVHTAAEGNGPVHALDQALRKALTEVYPSVSRMQLLDYKVRVLEGSQGTGAVVRVLIESGDGEERWSTVGASSNILEASWQALTDSLAYFLIFREGAGSTAAAD
ncbi:citramalate synthase [Symbiobacterium terraclitae]|uniref:citramalate synthase n=1 Tax=Symbiobacterium terraclitae TaxID=557451 RepID=UPI001AE45733|nr:citramalate synthase [Symbiobacterium terraclitae]